jgi:hypothetical protein
VYFFSSACDQIKWVEKERKVYDSKKKKVIDFYNHNFGNVDLADQLRNHYRYDSA